MADPDRILFTAADIIEGNVGSETTPPSYPTTGHFIYRNPTTGFLYIDRVDDGPTNKVGDRVWYTAPDPCYDDPTQRDYKQGSQRFLYPKMVEQWRGWERITYVLPFVDRDDYVLIWNQYAVTKDMDGWCWFSLWNGENRTWKLKLGIMDMPEATYGGGDMWRNVTLTFGFIQAGEYAI